LFDTKLLRLLLILADILVSNLLKYREHLTVYSNTFINIAEANFGSSGSNMLQYNVFLHFWFAVFHLAIVSPSYFHSIR
jgi:hypothetical protein